MSNALCMRTAVALAGTIGALAAAAAVAGASVRAAPSVVTAAPLSVSAKVGQLGASVASSGDTLVVGDPSLSNSKPGKLLVFRRPKSGNWRDIKPVAVLTLSGGQPSGLLGMRVAISGDTIVASDPARLVNGNLADGVVFVFIEPKGGWRSETESAELTAPDGAADLFLGESVAIAGDTIAAGAPNRGRVAGRIYTFTRGRTGWSHARVAELSAGSGVAGLGGSVAISATTVIAAGAPSKEGAGVVYVFRRPAGGWATTSTPSAVLHAGSPGATNGLGGSIAMSGTTIAASASRHSTGSNNQSVIDVFSRPAGGWRNSGPAAVLTDTTTRESDSLGPLTISGNTIIAGDPNLKLHNRFLGGVFLYRRPAAGWRSSRETSMILPPATTPDFTEFGSAAAAVGKHLVIGAPGTPVGDPSGRIYVAALP